MRYEFQFFEEEESSKDEDEQIAVRNLTIHYQEIFPSATVEGLSFQFHPIVEEEPCVVATMYSALNELPEICEEVFAAHSAINEQGKVVRDAIDALSVIFEEIIVAKEPESNRYTVWEDKNEQKETNFSDTIAIESLEHLQVIYEVIAIEKTTRSIGSIQDIDWAKAFKNEIKKDPDNPIGTGNIDESISRELLNISKPLFYDDEILSTIALIEDIAELGDQREIPQLHLLLQSEINVTVKTRIKELISLFSVTEDTCINFDPNIQDERQSVFHSLFEVSDAEAKVILLAEISEVGDEMEISLLKSLALSEENQVRKAAKMALMKLSSRLLIKTNNIIDTPLLTKEASAIVVSESDDLFTIEFDCDTSEIDTKMTEEKTTRRNN